MILTFVRKILYFPVLNLPARFFVKKLKKIAVYLSDKLRISGVCSVDYCGFRYKIYSKGDDAIHSKIYYDNQHSETDELMFFVHIAPFLNTFLDVGANIGMYPLLGSLANQHLHSICFEPHVPNAERMKLNLKLNGLDKQVVVAITLVGAETCKKQFTVPVDDVIIDTASVNHDWTKSFYNDRRKYQIIESDMVDLDGYVQSKNIQGIDFIKIDVETYEYEVLKGAIETITKFRPIVMCEVFYFVKNIIDIEDYFKNLGYSIWVIGKGVLLNVQNIRSCPEGKNYVFLPFEFGDHSNAGACNFFRINAIDMDVLGQSFKKRIRNLS